MCIARRLAYVGMMILVARVLLFEFRAVGGLGEEGNTRGEEGEYQVRDIFETNGPLVQFTSRV